MDVRDTGEWITEELRDYAQRKGEPRLQFSQGLRRQLFWAIQYRRQPKVYILIIAIKMILITYIETVLYKAFCMYFLT